MRKLFQRHLPDNQRIREHRYLQFLGHRLHDPDLWHLNRSAVAGGLSVGLFMAFMPIPFQMILAAPAAIATRVNLPIAVASVWISNPLTMPPMLITNYRVGAWLMQEPVHKLHFEFSLHWFTETALDVWEPLLLGSVFLGLLAAVLGNLAVRGLWRLQLNRRWRERRTLRLKSNK